MENPISALAAVRTRIEDALYLQWNALLRADVRILLAAYDAQAQEIARLRAELDALRHDGAPPPAGAGG